MSRLKKKKVSREIFVKFVPMLFSVVEERIITYDLALNKITERPWRCFNLCMFQFNVIRGGDDFNFVTKYSNASVEGKRLVLTIFFSFCYTYGTLNLGECSHSDPGSCL